MDDTIISRETIRQLGADAFDRGLGVDDHNMNPWVPAVADWQQGWRDRRAAAHAIAIVKFASQGATPP